MKTPRDSQLDQSMIDFDQIPEWSMAQITEAFKKIRDERFIEYQSKRRRIPWYYAENGCFARAALIRRKILELKYPRIMKLFIFGEMKFESQSLFSETITFKDHVACVARTGDGVFVFDPPMNFYRALRLEEWIEKLFSLSENSKAKLYLSSEYTLSHNGDIHAKSVEEEIGMKKGKLRNLDFFVNELMEKEENLLENKNINLEVLLCEKFQYRK